MPIPKRSTETAGNLRETIYSGVLPLYSRKQTAEAAHPGRNNASPEENSWEYGAQTARTSPSDAAAIPPLRYCRAYPSSPNAAHCPHAAASSPPPQAGTGSLQSAAHKSGRARLIYPFPHTVS
ncbi:hypothetical protein D3C81_1920770 [compost metagenome]